MCEYKMKTRIYATPAVKELNKTDSALWGLKRVVGPKKQPALTAKHARCFCAVEIYSSAWWGPTYILFCFRCILYLSV